MLPSNDRFLARCEARALKVTFGLAKGEILLERNIRASYFLIIVGSAVSGDPGSLGFLHRAGDQRFL